MVRVLDMFCGAGGSSSGARAAGAEIVCGIDCWKWAVQTYAHNFPTAKIFAERLTPESDASILRDVGHVDLILASPECTHHSSARGSHPRDEESRDTAYYVIKFAECLRPRWIIIENVIQMRTWHKYANFLESLRKLGYNITEQALIATDFGVPQIRKRLFILCDLEKTPEKTIPQNMTGRQDLSAYSVIDVKNLTFTRKFLAGERAQKIVDRFYAGVAALGQGASFLISHYTSDKPGWRTLDLPMRTLTTSPNFYLVVWDGNIPMIRDLYIDELMDVMGYSGYLELPLGSKTTKERLIGNGVCPPVMQAIVKQLCNLGVDNVA